MTTTLTQMTATQESKYSTFNDNIGSLSPAGFLGRRPVAITLLTWAYFGGKIWANGGWRTIANGTIACTASQTNYISLDLEGDGTDPAINVTTTDFIDGEIPIAEVVCDGTDITSEIDRRLGVSFDKQGRDEQVIAFASTITPDTLAGVLIDVGALTGVITINAPTNPFLGAQLTFMFEQDGTGGRIITWNSVFVKAEDEGANASAKATTTFFYDGTDWVQVGGHLNFDGSPIQTIAFSSTITPDALEGHIVAVGQLTGVMTINAPTNAWTGAKLTFLFEQDGTGFRVLTWNSTFLKTQDLGGGIDAKGSTTFIYDGADWVQDGGPLTFDDADVQTIAYSATITPDALGAEVVNVGALTAGITIAAPANAYAGKKLTFSFLQDGTGSFDITWNSVFKKATDPTAGTGNQIASTSFVYNGTNWVQEVGAFAWFS